MFRRRSFFFVLFLVLLVFGLFGVRQRSNFARGYSEGYAAAQQATSTETSESAAETSGSEANPAGASRSYPYQRGWSHFPIFGFFGLLLKFWLMFIIFGFFMKMLGFGRYRRWHHGHWRGCGEGAYEKQPEDVNPDIRHA